jgi:hypothetical protein
MVSGFLVGLVLGSTSPAPLPWPARAPRPDQASTFERAWTQTGDERENTLLTRALAVVGLVSLPLTGAATLFIGFGAEAPMVMTLFMGALFVTGISTFAILDHRY